MPNLLSYALYNDATEGASTAEMAERYNLSIDEIEERLEAARLCFEKQIDYIEFADDL
jgi:hypothetical protein